MHRRRGRRHRDRAARDAAARPPADRPARTSAPAGLLGERDPDALSSIASRLARLDRRLADLQRTQLTVLGGGSHRRTSPRHRRRARPGPAAPGGAGGPGRPSRRWPTSPRLEGAPRRGRRAARAEPRAPRAGRRGPPHPRAGDRRDLPRRARSRPATRRRRRDRARDTVESFGSVTARSTATRSPRSRCSTPSRTRGGSRFREVKELAETIEAPPHRWTPERLWSAYEALDRSRVRGSGAARAHRPRVAGALRAPRTRTSSCRTRSASASASTPGSSRRRTRAHLHARAARLARGHPRPRRGLARDRRRRLQVHAVRRGGRRRQGGAGVRRRLGPLLDELNEALVV